MRSDLTGRVFGRLTVTHSIALPRGTDGRRQRKWICQCECGGVTASTAGQLTGGGKISCGCYRREKSKQNATRHGLSKTREYKIFIAIHSRCYNKNVRCYKNYGGRGIVMSDEWRNDFTRFLADMGPRPSPDHQVDRIDVNGNYCADNCRWVPSADQAKNKRWHAALREIDQLKKEVAMLRQELLELKAAA